MLLTVDLQLIPTEFGGRQRPIMAGYRACWANGDVTGDGQTVYHDAPIVLLDPDAVQPGESGMAATQPILPDALGWDHVRVGDVLIMVEGSRAYGTATVKSIDPSYDPRSPSVLPGDIAGR